MLLPGLGALGIYDPQPMQNDSDQRVLKTKCYLLRSYHYSERTQGLVLLKFSQNGD